MRLSQIPNGHEDLTAPHQPEIAARKRFESGGVVAQESYGLAQRRVLAFQACEIACGVVVDLTSANNLGETSFADQAIHEQHASGKQRRVRPETPLWP
jgi:hypothetical protein